jgi:hypothetical protein
MTCRYWPLFDLRLYSPDLALRPMAESDLIAIADLLPDDVEQDPAATAYPVGDDRIRRGMVVHQDYWRSLGTWRPQAWRLSFVVSAAGAGAGACWLGPARTRSREERDRDMTNSRLMADPHVERHAATDLAVGEGEALGEEAHPARAGMVLGSRYAAYR